TRAQRRLRDVLVAQPSWESMSAVCKGAGVSSSSYYTWCHDPQFRNWLLSDWSGAMLMEGLHALNVARAQLSQSPQFIRIIIKLLFDPRGLAGLQAWRNAAIGLQPDLEPAQSVSGQNWTTTPFSAPAASPADSPAPADRPAPAPAPAPRPANHAYARIGRTAPPPLNPSTAVLHLTRAVRALTQCASSPSRHRRRPVRSPRCTTRHPSPRSPQAKPAEAARPPAPRSHGITPAAALPPRAADNSIAPRLPRPRRFHSAPNEATWTRPEQSGRALPPSEFRPQPDARGPQGACALGWEHREGVLRRAVVPHPLPSSPPPPPPTPLAATVIPHLLAFL
ncbi:MAG: hypothetical protein ACRD01_02910, partial [Terriglobales bacterium]